MSEPPEEPSPEFLRIMQELDRFGEAIDQLGKSPEPVTMLRDFIASRELRERLDRIEQRLDGLECQIMDTRAQVGLPQPGDDS